MKELTIQDCLEIATRQHLRIQYHGNLSVEDLWDLNTDQLNEIYMGLRKRQKDSESESLIEVKTPGSNELDVSIMLVKHIFQVKIDEKNALKLKREKAAKRKRIRELIAQKEDETLMSSSKEELEKLLAEEDE